MDLQIISNDFHKSLLQKIEDCYPAVQKATENFNKTQSQFMDNMMTISQLTPLRSARQCLAEIKKSRMAVQEAYFKIKKKEIRIRMKKNQRGLEKNKLNSELISLEIAELEMQIANIKENVNGAIRRISNYMAQYNNILEKHGKQGFTEADFEEDEERYHIMKAFEQGLNAARSRGGIIDEGNFIYFFQVGISGTAAQIEVKNYFLQEDKVIQSGQLPTHGMQIEWLERMADKYQGSASRFAEYKGVALTDEKSLIK